MGIQENSISPSYQDLIKKTSGYEQILALPLETVINPDDPSFSRVFLSEVRVITHILAKEPVPNDIIKHIMVTHHNPDFIQLTIQNWAKTAEKPGLNEKMAHFYAQMVTSLLTTNKTMPHNPLKQNKLTLYSLGLFAKKMADENLPTLTQALQQVNPQ